MGERNRIEVSTVSDFNRDDGVYQSIRETIIETREFVRHAVNTAMVHSYWKIGKDIHEAQGGEERARYGEGYLKSLSKELTTEFGRGYTVTNLMYMRQFYRAFPIHHALRDELSWTHYRQLIRIDDETKRDYYLDECAKGRWSTRQLERQIRSSTYERLLSAQRKNGSKPINQMTSFRISEKLRICLRILMFLSSLICLRILLIRSCHLNKHSLIR